MGNVTLTPQDRVCGFPLDGYDGYGWFGRLVYFHTANKDLQDGIKPSLDCGIETFLPTPWTEQIIKQAAPR